MRNAFPPIHPTILKALPFVLTWLIAPLALAVEEPKPTSSPSKDDAIEAILTTRESPEALAKAIDTARKAGVNEQAIFEARFLFHVDRKDDAALAALLPEAIERDKQFRIGDSQIFAVAEDWKAIVEYIRALDSLQKNDAAGFKQHIMEAFWLSPRQSAAFTPHIERLRLAQAMKGLRVDLSAKLTKQDKSGAVVLSELLGENKALILHFWSPLSRECEVNMPDFSATAGEFAKNGIPVVSILPDYNDEVLKTAKEMIDSFKSKPSCVWLLDRETDPLHTILRVQNVPTMVLLSKDGAILFNGNPGEEELWDAVQRISPDIKRPKRTEEE